MNAQISILIMLQQALLFVTIYSRVADLCFAQTTSAFDLSNSSDLTSTAVNEIQTHTITVGKVAQSSAFPHCVRARQADKDWRMNNRLVTSTLQTPFRQQSTMSSVRLDVEYLQAGGSNLC